MSWCALDIEMIHAKGPDSCDPRPHGKLHNAELILTTLLAAIVARCLGYPAASRLVLLGNDIWGLVTVSCLLTAVRAI